MFEFRKLLAKDFIQWKSLWNDYLVFYETDLSEEITETAWQRIVSGDIESIGVFDSGKLIAFMHFHTQINTWKIGKVYYLEDLFVSSEYRRQGIAKSLIEHLFHLAKNNGYERVYWLTDKNNKQAQALYEQFAHQTDYVLYKAEF